MKRETLVTVLVASMSVLTMAGCSNSEHAEATTVALTEAVSEAETEAEITTEKAEETDSGKLDL